MEKGSTTKVDSSESKKGKLYKEVIIMQLYIYNGQVTTYYITTTGELYNSKTNKWLKGQINYKNGYKTYSISIDGQKKRLYAHRMVAQTYIPNNDPILKTEVHHINGNKLDNSVSNLEWISPKVNKEKVKTEGLSKLGARKVYCFDENKKLVAIYPSIAECGRVTGYNISWIMEQLRREVKTLSHGYYWSYTEDNTFQTVATRIQPTQKKVGQYNANGVLIGSFLSLSEAGRKTRFDRHRISDCCNGKISTYKGYIWKFIQ